MEKVIVFGTGKRLEEIMVKGYLNEMEVIAFCDNNEEKWGDFINGIKIISPRAIKEQDYDAIYISSYRYFGDIKQQLVEECGILSEKVKSFEIYDKKYKCEIKHNSEIAFWEEDFRLEGNIFRNNWYKKLMLAIAEEQDDSFLAGKVVADFGCGPKGSLAWTNRPIVKLGIDVLADRYLEKFSDELIRHNMIYVKSTETRIPIPDCYVDYLFTINSLDHVANLEAMTNELLRIIKPGGILLASFNLNEPSTECEPQTLTEEMIKNLLLRYFEVDSYRLAYKDEEKAYVNIMNNNLVCSLKDDKPAILWVKGRKL